MEQSASDINLELISFYSNMLECFVFCVKSAALLSDRQSQSIIEFDPS